MGAVLLASAAAWALAAPVSASAAPASAQAAGTTGQLNAPQAPLLPAQETLFTSNTVIGGRSYACFRVPSVVRANDGTLLAFAEGRLTGGDCADTKEMDIVLRRSTDGGTTWLPPQIVARGLPTDTAGTHTPAIDMEPTPIVDATVGSGAGQVVLLYNVRQLASDGTINNPAGGVFPIKTHVLVSSDDGAGWSGDQDISAQVNPTGVGFFVSGPGHGIQLRHGDCAGWLVAPTYESVPVPNQTNVFGHVAAALYRDTNGVWHRGASTPNDLTAQYAGEPSIAELSDGRLLMTARNNKVNTAAGDAAGDNRLTFVSTNCGASWQPLTGASALPGATVFAPVLAAADAADGDAYHQLVITQPVYHDPSATNLQGTLIMRSSFDDGLTWQTPDQGLVIAKAGAGYSDLTRTAGGGIGVLYEAGPDPSKISGPPASSRTTVRFTVVSSGQSVITGPVTGARTPDTAAGGNAAVLRGGAKLTAGRFGRAVTFTPNSAGATGWVDVTPSPAYARIDGDFTVAADFKYNATDGLRPIIWGFGVGAGLPQLWVRGDPANHRISADATTSSGSTTLNTTQAYNDNTWHHVAFQRSGSQLLLWIDGVQVASGAAPSGAISPSRPQPLEIGNRIDGAQPYAGSIDDVVLYDRALSAQEITAAANSGTYSGVGPLLHLPFDSGVPDPRSWGDIDGDGRLDVLGRTTVGDLRYFPTVGDVTAGSPGDVSLQNPTAAGTGFDTSFHPARGDFNNDGIGDLIAKDNQNRLEFWLGQGDGSFSPPVVLLPGTSFQDVMAVSGGDFNNDGLTDILGLGYDGSLWWWPSNGDRTFGARQNLVPGTAFAGYQAVPTGDFNGDGRTDVAGVDASGTLWWWAGDGNGGLSTAQQLAPGTSFAAYGHTFTADVNGDGATDFVGLDSSGVAHWWPGDGNGHVSGTARTLSVLSQDSTPAATLGGDTYTF
ncbi:FG-GAP-like repeat-containing protein [Actinacidiphila acididurans]|uniref:FG-GAP-like repeat-containing protein n=1 Tax=Actinacidiphila acididurans TaxID=2784346 RepID=UPI0027DD46E2|nr:FG-GAP-like repeat-containing protein [Actinacidiphila acididurans]